ncbi:MAG: peroxiredoxin-like family protein [Candidatus Didemnitutus sp.]|nr:peroxiredoxin-like family protein [Candidatus Didemnitutus sp.]
MSSLVMAEPASDWAKVGDTVPDVKLLTADDAAVSLREVVKEKPAVLIFYRGGWCPYCNRHLGALAEIEGKVLAAGYQILAISPDQPAKLKATPDREKLGYRLLSDRKAEAAQALGIAFEVPAELVAKYKNEYKIDLEAASGETHHLLPHPAVFVIGRDGVIRYAHVNPDYKIRLTPEEILAVIEAK